jgi:hypothetical protein
MSKSILEEAMEDAKLLKETAVKNAQNVLVEAISPKIKEFVDSQLGEGEVEEDLGGMYEKEEEPMEFPPEGEEEVDEVVVCAEGEDKKDDDEELEEAAEEVVEITEEDMRRAFNEILRSEISEATVSSNFGDAVDPTPKNAGGSQDTGIADEKSGEHQWKDEEPPDSEDWTVESLHKAYKKKLAEVVRVAKKIEEQRNQYKQAAMYLKRNLQEVNLFNSKLLYTNKLLQGVNLNNKARVAVIEAFDRAQTLREVEMTFKNISESLKIAGVMSESKSKKPKSSRYTASSGTSKVLEESVRKESGAEDFSERMQRLSGIVD